MGRTSPIEDTDVYAIDKKGNYTKQFIGRLAIVLGFPSGGLRFESWGDASGFTPVVRGFLRIGGLLFGVTKVVVTAGGAIAVLTDPPSTNLTPPVPKKDYFRIFRRFDTDLDQGGLLCWRFHELIGLSEAFRCVVSFSNLHINYEESSQIGTNDKYCTMDLNDKLAISSLASKMNPNMLAEDNHAWTPDKEVALARAWIDKHLNEYYNYYVMRFVTNMHSVERYTLFSIQQRVLICSHAKVDKFQALDHPEPMSTKPKRPTNAVHFQAQTNY
ncbi:hypothetical protein LXL04_026409 [Taraxacum kok-saghyz]